MKNQREKIRIRFFRTNGRKINQEANGQFVKEFNSIRELKIFFSNCTSRSIYCVNLTEDLTPSQYQAYVQNDMCYKMLKEAMERHQKDGWYPLSTFEDWKRESKNAYRLWMNRYKKDVKKNKKKGDKS